MMNIEKDNTGEKIENVNWKELKSIIKTAEKEAIKQNENIVFVINVY